MALPSGRVATVRGKKKKGQAVGKGNAGGGVALLAQVAREGPSEQGLEGGKGQVNTWGRVPRLREQPSKGPK